MSRDFRPGFADEEEEEEAAATDRWIASSASGSDPGGNGRAPESILFGK